MLSLQCCVLGLECRMRLGQYGHVVHHTSLNVLLQVFMNDINLAAQPTERAGYRPQRTCISMGFQPFPHQFLPTPQRTREGEHGTPINVFPCNELILSYTVAQTAVDRSPGTLCLSVFLHLTSKYNSFAFIWAGQCDVQASIVVGSRDMVSILSYLELFLAAMLSVGAVDLQLSNLPAFLLQENF